MKVPSFFPQDSLSEHSIPLQKDQLLPLTALSEMQLQNPVLSSASLIHPFSPSPSYNELPVLPVPVSESGFRTKFPPSSSLPVPFSGSPSVLTTVHIWISLLQSASDSD